MPLAVKPRSRLFSSFIAGVAILLIAHNQATRAENDPVSIYERPAARFLVNIQTIDDGGSYILAELAVIRTEAGDFEVWDHKVPVRITSAKRPTTGLLGKVSANQLSQWFKKWELIEKACRAETTQREFQHQAGILTMTDEELSRWRKAHPEQKLEHGNVTTIHVTFIAHTGERHDWREDLGASSKDAWELVQDVHNMVTPR